MEENIKEIIKLPDFEEIFVCGAIARSYNNSSIRLSASISLTLEESDFDSETPYKVYSLQTPMGTTFWRLNGWMNSSEGIIWKYNNIEQVRPEQKQATIWEKY